METLKSENPESIGSVKAAISLFGERINGKKQERINNEEGIEKTNEERHNQLDRQIEVADTKTTEFIMTGNQSTGKPVKSISSNDRCNEDVKIQLDKMKRDLRKLQLDVRKVSEANEQTKKEAEASAVRAQSAALKVEEIKIRLEEANEEHAIVELARIEAERETREIEAKRETEAKRYKIEIESMKEKIDRLKTETGRERELEAQLAVINLDVAVLQNEMKFVREMEASISNKRKDEVDRSASELKNTEAEIMLAMKELESVKEEGFQYMGYMDRTRCEILKIREEVFLLKEKEKKVDSTVQNLNSKLLKAKSKLESALVDKERSRTIVGSLESALDQMQTEIGSAKKEKELIIEETNRVIVENEKILRERSSIEERARQLVTELQTVKASERVVMKNLKSTMERTIMDRFYNIDQRKSGGILTISKLEYDYLIHAADRTKFVADKKVAACQAWVEALRSGEKEIRLRTQLIHKEIERMKEMEIEKNREVQRDVESEMEMYDSINACVIPPKNAYLLAQRRSTRENRVSITSKGVKVRRVSVSSMSRVNTRSPSVTVKRKKRVPNLIKFNKKRGDPAIGEPSE